MSYSELIVSDSPLGYWELNSSNPVNPNLMSSSTATYAIYSSSVITSGVKSLIAGINGGSKIINFTGSIVVPNSYYVLKAGNQNIPVTMELWFTTIAPSSQNYYLISPYSTTSSAYAFRCYIKNDKLWLESGDQKDYIAIANFDQQQYLNITVLNGNISVNLNNTYSLNVYNPLINNYNYDQFIIGPATSDGPLFVNSFAVYKYTLTPDQVSKRIYYSKYVGNVNQLYLNDGFSYYTGNITPNILSSYDVISDDFFNFSFNKNIELKNNTLSLRKLPDVNVLSTTDVTDTLYSINGNGIKFNSASNYSSYIDLSDYMSNFIGNYSGVRLQFDVSTGSRVNLMPNPSVESLYSNFYYENSGQPMSNSSEVTPFTGSSVLKIFTSFQNYLFGYSGGPVYGTGYIPVTANKPYTFSAYLQSDSTEPAHLRLYYYTSASTATTTNSVNYSVFANAPYGKWTRFYVTASAPADAVWAKVLVGLQNNSVQPHRLYADGFLLEQSASVGNYFDGSMTNASWTGTPHQSTSVETIVSSGNLINFYGLDGYKSLSAELNQTASGPLVQLILTDNNDKIYKTINSPSLVSGTHNLLIKFTSSSIAMSIDNVPVSGSLDLKTISGRITSMYLGADRSQDFNLTNLIESKDFTYNIDGWTTYLPNTGLNVQQSNAFNYLGVGSIKLTASSTVDPNVYYINNGTSSVYDITPTRIIPVVPNQQYILRMPVLSTACNAVYAKVQFYDSLRLNIGSATQYSKYVVLNSPIDTDPTNLAINSNNFQTITNGNFRWGYYYPVLTYGSQPTVTKMTDGGAETQNYLRHTFSVATSASGQGGAYCVASVVAGDITLNNGDMLWLSGYVRTNQPNQSFSTYSEKFDIPGSAGSANAFYNMGTQGIIPANTWVRLIQPLPIYISNASIVDRITHFPGITSSSFVFPAGTTVDWSDFNIKKITNYAYNNGDLEDAAKGTTGWNTSGAGTLTTWSQQRATISGSAQSGSAFLRTIVTAVGTAWGGAMYNASVTNLNPGDTLWATVYVKSNETRTVYPYFEFKDSNGQQLYGSQATSVGVQIGGGSWTFVSGSILIPNVNTNIGNINIYPAIGQDGPSVLSASVDYDNFKFYKVPSANTATWDIAEAIVTAPSNAAYAIPILYAGNNILNSTVYMSSPEFIKYNASYVGLAFNNNIKNFFIDEYSETVSDYSSNGYFGLKFNNNLNISQKGYILGLLPNKNADSGANNAYITYSNQSSNINIEYGKYSSGNITWSTASTNYPLIGADLINNTADQLRITLTNDNSFYETESIQKLKIIYLNNSYFNTHDEKYSIKKRTTTGLSSSLAYPIPSDIYSDFFSRSNNLGLRTIPRITNPIDITYSREPIQRVDFLFKINSYPTSGSGFIFNNGTNNHYAYINNSGSLTVVNPTNSTFYIDGTQITSNNTVLLVGEAYLASLYLFIPYTSLVLGVNTGSTGLLDASFGEIYISSSGTSYSSNAAFISKVNNNLISKETIILGNNLLSEQMASAELYNELSASWGFNSVNGTLTRSGTYYVNGASSIKIIPVTNATTIISTDLLSNNLIKVVAGRNYNAIAKILSTPNSRSAQCEIIWFSSQNVSSSISVTSGTTYNTLVGAWLDLPISASAPMNANYAAVRVKINSAQTADTHYVDCLGLLASNVTNWTIPNKNNLKINDGVVQTLTDQAKNYLSSDSKYFQMYGLPKVKITSKRSSTTIIR